MLLRLDTHMYLTLWLQDVTPRMGLPNERYGMNVQPNYLPSNRDYKALNRPTLGAQTLWFQEESGPFWDLQPRQEKPIQTNMDNQGPFVGCQKPIQDYVGNYKALLGCPGSFGEAPFG